MIADHRQTYTLNYDLGKRVVEYSRIQVNHSPVIHNNPQVDLQHLWELHSFVPVLLVLKYHAMDRYGADDRSSSAARSSRSLRNKASATYSSYRDDASVSSHSTSRSNSFAPIWADPIARNSGPPENFHDEDIFSYDPHSYAPAGTSTGSAHGGSTIVGTFRPSMDEMVDVNVSGHGKSFHNSSESLFRDRGDRNVRRSSVFAVGLEDIEYDAVDMSKRRCFSGLVFALIVSIVIVTTVVVVEKPSGNNPSTAALVPATAPAPAPVPNGQYVDPSVPASDCDFSGILEPDVFFQCRCHGHISIFSEGALEKYNDLKINFLAKDVLPDYHSKIDSCDPPNAALVWLATDTFPQGRETLDRYMLVLLYAAWRGYSWTHTDNWLSNQTHCDWYGIQCDSRMRTIDVLLNNNNLRGEIPSEISRLDSLLSLDVGNNQLDGRIPREIGLLASLQNLRLRGNKLSFSIPTEFGLLANLKALELDQNKLAGTIPTELMILPPLGSLDLSDNNLTGIIPSEIGNLKNCRKWLISCPVSLRFSLVILTLPVILKANSRFSQTL